jgi:hypothetical protein
MKNRGFLDNDHREKFEAGRSLVRRGGPQQNICGAKTRSGQLCRSAPLEGHWRCLRHAGPKAAHELRNRQLRDLALGRLSAEAFAKLEARREANRLHGLWRRDPWAEGATINLGNQEVEFRRLTSRALVGAAPSVEDWLRWQFYRHRMRAPNPERWRDAVGPKLAAKLASVTEPKVRAERVRARRAPIEYPVCDPAIFVDPAPVRRLLASAKTDQQHAAIAASLKNIRERPADARAWNEWIRVLLELRL